MVVVTFISGRLSQPVSLLWMEGKGCGINMASLVKKITFPPEWSDEDRMYFLIAPLPPGVQPTLSDAKIMFWKTLILSSSRDLNKCVFTERELRERLQWRGMQPKGLRNVIEIMERTGEIRKQSSYQLNEESGWVEWGATLLSSPLSWAWRRYVSSSGSAQGREENEEYVIVAFVKELAEKAFTSHTKRVIHAVTDSVVTYSDFEENCRTILNNLSAQTCRAVELQLTEDKLIRKAVSKDNRDVIVKLASRKGQTVTAVTETDFGIVSIKGVIVKLQAQILEQFKKSRRLKQRCAELLRNKNKSRAIHHLRLSKSVEAQVIKLETHLENLQAVINQIEMAETNAAVVNAYESGCSTLKNLRDEYGLSLEKAERVMDEVQQLLEEGDDLNNELGKDRGANELDDDELLKELHALVTQDEMNSEDAVHCEPINQSPDVKTKPQLDFNEEELMKELDALTLDDSKEGMGGARGVVTLGV